MVGRAQYLLRFDDICPTMNWEVWSKIESVLTENNIRPILAVVPDNRDPKLMVDAPCPQFWEKVRKWQASGWTIALHGYQHRYVNSDPGFLRLTPQSEFAGLSRAEQEHKLRKGLAIFSEQGVRADCWVAPSHSFDYTTVELLAELSVKAISDGLWPLPHTDQRGVTWVPQQVWGRIRSMPFGTWTTCFHHNSWGEAEIALLKHDVQTYGPRITSLPAVLERFAGRPLKATDRVFAGCRLGWHKALSSPVKRTPHAATPTIRLTLIVRALDHGGAERQLVEVIKSLDPNRFAITVVSFYAGGVRWSEVQSIRGVRLISLDKRGRWDVGGFLWRAFRAAEELKPDIVYSFAGEPNLLALVLGRFRGPRVIWGIRRSTKVLPRKDRLAMASFRIGARLSRFADRLVYNSYRGRDLHSQRGYATRNAIVIPNGFDTEKFRPDDEARRRQRSAWGLTETDLLIGIVGRLHPVKDHPLFLTAAAQITRTHPNTRFVSVGEGPREYRTKLQDTASALGLDGRILWINHCSDMQSVHNALDILVLCSTEEGCPNVVGEAMACGVPCVVTDVGDAARMVGHPESVVPPSDPAALAAALQRLLDMSPEERRRLGGAGRERIIAEYSLEKMARRTADTLEQVLS